MMAPPPLSTGSVRARRGRTLAAISLGPLVSIANDDLAEFADGTLPADESVGEFMGGIPGGLVVHENVNGGAPGRLLNGASVLHGDSERLFHHHMHPCLAQVSTTRTCSKVEVNTITPSGFAVLSISSRSENSKEAGR